MKNYKIFWVLPSKSGQPPGFVWKIFPTDDPTNISWAKFFESTCKSKGGANHIQYLDVKSFKVDSDGVAHFSPLPDYSEFEV